MVGNPTSDQVVQALNAAHTKIAFLQSQIQGLQAAAGQAGALGASGVPGGKKDLKELKSFGDVQMWDGTVKSFSDFE